MAPLRAENDRSPDDRPVTECAARIKAMQSVLYIDSRMRSEGTDSSFSIGLRESLHPTEHGMRVDKLRLTNSFLTTDLGRHIYYKDGSGGITSYAIPEQAYTGAQLTGGDFTSRDDRAGVAQ